MDDITTLEYIIASQVLDNPEILEMEDPRDLFKIDEFKFRFAERMPPDNDMTYVQACFALAKVKEKFPKKKYIFYAVGEKVDA